MTGNSTSQDVVLAGTLEELAARGRLVVRGRHRPVLVVLDRGRVVALDDRCPHMGFPLDRGTIEDGILTCPWHHARFDVSSGCAFDLWADDVPTCPVEVRDGVVWVQPTFGYPDPAGHWCRRLDDGMAHDLGLVVAKATAGLLGAGTPPAAVVRQAALFGASNRDGWGVGLTILTALGNLLPFLPDEETHLALFHGCRRVAADCDGQPPRRERAPLASATDPATLKRWLRRWVAVRHRDGAERTLLTAVAASTPPAALADMLLAAATDRAFADGGHALDFINKAFECLDLIGWEHAAAILPTVAGHMVEARGAEETSAWRQPVDLIALLERTFAELPALFTHGRGRGPWNGHAALASRLLGDDPAAIVGALEDAIRAGAVPADLSKALAYAAALRVARFGTANEHGDWQTAHHAFTYANAVHQGLKRIGAGDPGEPGDPEAVRGVFHGAMAVYLTRYLNVPPARLPGETGNQLEDLPTDGQALRAALLDALDRRHQVDAAGQLVARYLMLGHSAESLIATLARALLREDAGFHAFQMLEAGVRQCREWGGTDQGRHVLIAVTRYLAAHSPTERTAYQTADIARRLMRGAQLHEEAVTAATASH
jgi:nitrite reductase/ring-hydroxylating ferredoxin subunit